MYIEEWNDIAQATMDREYRRIGVELGDHVGYFLVRTKPIDALMERMRAGGIVIVAERVE